MTRQIGEVFQRPVDPMTDPKAPAVGVPSYNNPRSGYIVLRDEEPDRQAAGDKPSPVGGV